MSRLAGWLFFLCLVLVGPRLAWADQVVRNHQFLRTKAMGDAFVAVTGYSEAIAYNPAGLLDEDLKWSLSFPWFWISYNEMVKKGIEGDLNLEGTDSYGDLPGTRIFVEQQLSLLPWWVPSWGFYFGVSEHLWTEFVFPAQTVVPMVHLEAILQGNTDTAWAYRLGQSGLILGANAKVVQRFGIIADISLLRAANLDQEELEQEYNSDPPGPKLSYDLGMIYEFSLPWEPRLGMSVLDVGGVDYGSAGSVDQLTSLGLSLHQQALGFDFTFAADYQDATFTYFNHNSITRRIALGAEAAFGKGKDGQNLVDFQVGLQELKYPSYGFSIQFAFIKLAQAVWTENFGTESNPVTDKRYMILISFEI